MMVVAVMVIAVMVIGVVIAMVVIGVIAVMVVVMMVVVGRSRGWHQRAEKEAYAHGTADRKPSHRFLPE
jgi:uncharacterized protein (DUF2062 family)